MTEIMENIANSSKEQVVGIDQVNQAVIEIDRATQDNASLVGELAGASKAMNDQAHLLHELLWLFRVAGSNENADPARLRAPGKPARRALA
jgi:methyl-accepting chemotaxis protein